MGNNCRGIRLRPNWSSTQSLDMVDHDASIRLSIFWWYSDSTRYLVRHILILARWRSNRHHNRVHFREKKTRESHRVKISHPCFS